MKEKYLGDKAFYRHAFAIAVPIIIQNGITNFVSLLDNIMVGQVGTMPMTGVSIMNQLVFVFNLCIFGACSGAGIFTAQFYGSADDEGIRYTFRFKALIVTVLSILAAGIFFLKGDVLGGLYLQGEGSAADAADALGYGLRYLNIMLIGFLPFALTNAYSGTLRETGQTLVPMIGGITAVGVNLVLNYVLIFGHFGAPAMGVEGAAIATVISRFVELLLVGGWTHLNSGRNRFIVGAYRSVHIPVKLLKNIAVKGLPLLANEFLWSVGIALLNQCYSTCALEVVPAMNICNTLSNLSSVVFLSMGNAVGIIMGQMLGAGNSENTLRDTNRKLLFMAVCSGFLCSAAMAVLGIFFPGIYNTTASVRHLASELIIICALFMPVHSFLNSTYFTLRSGGQAFITFLFDSAFVWVCSVPVAYGLSRFTALSIIPIYIMVNCMDVFKCALGYYLLKKGSWIQNLT